MTQPFTLRKATRQQTKIRIGISGPSGSGKTYSALLLASGMAPWDKIAVIDTENGSADLYSHLGGYSVITLTAPFSPERYIEAIAECEKAGMEVIVIDSATHEWDGKGGLLESNELIAQTKFKGNTWSAWSVTTPRHQRFIAAIVGSRCHVITTARSKTDTIQTEDKKIKKVGMKEIQREGWEYELTINFTLERDGHYATASKDRTELFSESDPFKITPETGTKILEWAKQGAVPLATIPADTFKAGETVHMEVMGEVTGPTVVTAKPAATKEKLPPSLTESMERMNEAAAKTDKVAFQAHYDEAMAHPQSPDNATTLAQCYVNGICRMRSWVTNGTKTQLFDGATLVADVVPDKAGKVKIVPVAKTSDEEAMAESERKGMAADSATAA